MRLSYFRLVAAAALIAGAAAMSSLLPAPLAAQTPSNPAPYNVDLGALITNTLRTAGTVTTSPQANTNWRGVVCRYLGTVSSGSPSVTFSIEGYDAATASYAALATSGAITTAGETTGATLLVYPGAVLTTTPTGWVLNSIPLPRTWRVSQTIGGSSSPGVTSKIGCNYLL